MMDPMHCDSCGHTERDPIMLDVETCSECGGLLTAFDDDPRAEEEAGRERADEERRRLEHEEMERHYRRHPHG